MGQTVFRGYDREALDREYNNRAKVKDAAEWLERYARASAAARTELSCRLDVAYGPSPGETLDIFAVPGSTGAPVNVFIHGGYWHRLDKADFSFVARGLLPAGAAVVVINYALIPTVEMDELVGQCRAAIAWVYRHAASFGGDPGRIFVSGHSAGGHLVAMLMSTDWAAAGLPVDVIRAGCGISGLYDLEPIRLSYLNDILRLTPETARRWSPIHHPPAHAGPLLLAVGALEGPEYLRQSHELARIWLSHGLRAEVVEMAGHHHFSIVAELEDPASELSRRLARQMRLA
ncbi:MAG TPA: alpha/beta hydrolase [Candidatus Limnocylindria bacterium]|nr:alpha/beta hydrolase [Candidatus Limnocylindria bacterium]